MTDTVIETNPSLSAPGPIAGLINNGYIAEGNGITLGGTLATPETTNTDVTAPAVDNVVTGEVTVPPSKEIDKDNIIIRNKLTDTGREYVTYGGTYVVEFFPDQLDSAKAFLNANVDKLAEYKSSVYEGRLFVFNQEASNEKLVEQNIDIVELRKEFDQLAVDLTPLFDDVKTLEVNSEQTSFYLFNTIQDKKDIDEYERNMVYFNSDVRNLPNYFVGGSLSNDNVGFYIDVGGNFRATYDLEYLGLAKPLLSDLTFFGATDDDYAIGVVDNRMVQIVVATSFLEETLVKQLGNYNVLAARYNNPRSVAPTFTDEEINAFEKALSRTRDGEGKLISVNDLFGLATTEEKKTV